MGPSTCLRHLRPLLAALALGAGCAQDELAASCDALCGELVQSCGFENYPSLDSCLDGCFYAADQGADVPAEANCVAAAGCDLFTIMVFTPEG